jgi:hypothetical protein
LERADPLLRRNVGGNQEIDATALDNNTGRTRSLRNPIRGAKRTQRKATPTWIMIQRLIVVHQPTELFDGVIAADIS